MKKRITAVVAGVLGAAWMPLPQAPDPAVGPAIAAERGRITRCASPASIAVVVPEGVAGAEPAGAGMFIAALQKTRLRSGPVTIVERSAPSAAALTTEACALGATQSLIFAKFIAVVGLTSSASGATVTVTVANTSTGAVVFADRASAGSVAAIDAFMESAARQTNAAISVKNYQCRDTFDLVATGSIQYACAKASTTTASMRETTRGAFPVGLTIRNVNPWVSTPQRLSGSVSLSPGAVSADGVIETGVTARPCSGMRSTFNDRLAWSRGAETAGTFSVTAPGATAGAWTVSVEAADTRSLFGAAGATATAAVTAGAAPGDCPQVKTSHSQPFTPRRGFALPPIQVDVACRPAVRVPLSVVPAMSFSLMALETGQQPSDCSARLADLTFSLVRRTSGP